LSHSSFGSVNWTWSDVLNWSAIKRKKPAQTRRSRRRETRTVKGGLVTRKK
jgi:hypothetical protein